MLFNSTVFLVLFFFVYMIYWELPLRWKHNLIIAASLIFYGWYSVPFLLMFLALIVVNYYASMALVRKKSKGLFFSILLMDAGILAFFKYFYLLAELTGSVLGIPYLAHLDRNWIHDYGFHIPLPIAISFYTFQIIAFVVDCYRGVIREHVEARKFFLFTLFFPVFVAGPIMRSTDFLPQIDRLEADRDRILNGVLLLLQGIVKKVLIADRLGSFTAKIWHAPSSYDAIFLLLIMPAFIAQVYMDFSGYTDMARGLARALGFDIPENFRGPFLSRSMQELWSRWHITLSTWLRDYIYIPLGGSRQGEARTMLNLIITMALGGLWHGASWTMLFWGLYLGVYLAVERFFRVKKIRLLPEGLFFDSIRRLWIFAAFAFSSIFFAAPDLPRAIAILKGIATFQRGIPGDAGGIIALTVIAYVFNLIQYVPVIQTKLQSRVGLRYALVGSFTFVVGFLVSLYGDTSGSFIYFQF